VMTSRVVSAGEKAMWDPDIDPRERQTSSAQLAVVTRPQLSPIDVTVTVTRRCQPHDHGSVLAHLDNPASAWSDERSCAGHLVGDCRCGYRQKLTNPPADVQA
jgi:hypothetical protein